MLDLSAVAFVDVETTGLDLERHEIWEVALIVDEKLFHWFVAIDEGRADPVALAVGGYYERRPVQLRGISSQSRVVDDRVALSLQFGAQRQIATIAQDVSELTRGRALVGTNASFDFYRLDRFLRANGACPGWHYRPIDVGGMAFGYLTAKWQAGVMPEADVVCGAGVPWSSADVAECLGIDLGRYERHTALGDALLAKAIYTAVMQ